MKRFSDFITEEVVPAALVQNGSIDLDKEEVRASINMALAKVTADGSVTPYIALNRIQKALAYFHIILPKRVYMEGGKGVEVHELRQFGHKMGMTDTGEFVSEVPGKYYLFMQYSMNTPMVHGGQKAWPTMAGTFRVMAKVVDKVELDRLISMAELALAEECDAETMQRSAKMLAPKESMHDVTSDEKKKGNKEAVSTSEKGLDEASTEKLIRYRNKAGEGREKGVKLAHAKLTGKAKVPATMPKHSYMEEDKDPCWKGYEMIGMKKKGGRKVPNCVPVKEEEQIDELDQSTLKAYKSAAKDDRRVSKRIIKKGLDTNDRFKMIAKKRKKGLRMVADRLEEKLTKSMSASDVIRDFVHSKDPKFEGKSTKERQKMALGAYYGMHPEKSKK